MTEAFSTEAPTYCTEDFIYKCNVNALQHIYNDGCDDEKISVSVVKETKKFMFAKQYPTASCGNKRVVFILEKEALIWRKYTQKEKFGSICFS